MGNEDPAARTAVYDMTQPARGPRNIERITEPQLCIARSRAGLNGQLHFITIMYQVQMQSQAVGKPFCRQTPSRGAVVVVRAENSRCRSIRQTAEHVAKCALQIPMHAG